MSLNLKKGTKPSIIVNSLLLSEIFNAYTRICFRIWKENLRYDSKNRLTPEQIVKKEYKKDYRKTSDFDQNVKTFSSDLHGYREYIILMDDDAIQLDPFDMLSNFPANTDFNDYYYYLFCHKHKISIVTDDGDFCYAGIEIISNNTNLPLDSKRKKN